MRTAAPTQMSAPRATTSPMSGDSAGSAGSGSVAGEGAGSIFGLDFTLTRCSAGRIGDGSVTSAMPIAAVGFVSSFGGASTDAGVPDACVASGSFAQPGKPSDGMTVKLLLHLGQ